MDLEPFLHVCLQFGFQSALTAALGTRGSENTCELLAGGCHLEERI